MMRSTTFSHPASRLRPRARVEAQTFNVDCFEAFGAQSVARRVALRNPQRLDRNLHLLREELSAKVLH